MKRFKVKWVKGEYKYYVSEAWIEEEVSYQTWRKHVNELRRRDLCGSEEDIIGVGEGEVEGEESEDYIDGE